MDGSPSGLAADIYARLEALAGIVADTRACYDADRRLPAAVYEAMAEADLFRLLAPGKFGGAELPLVALFDVVEAASRLDGSVGWIVANGAIMSRHAGYLPEETARAWFSDPDCLIASSTGAVGVAKPADGGYMVSGRWPFASGIHGARRVMALAADYDGRPPEARELLAVYIPVESLTVHDVWHVSGLRGTGSCDFCAEAVFVPRAHTHGFMTARPIQPGPLYRIPILSAFPLSVTLVAIGIAAAAVDEFAALSSRTRWGTGTALRDRETIQTELGRADMMRRAARALVTETLRDLEDALAVRPDELVPTRAAFRAALTQAGELCERTTAIVCTAAGTASIREDTPLERRQRDLLAAVKHIAMAPHNLAVHGRVRLGLDPGTARF
jgi:indole-3-acetate monooxygenase